MSSHLTLLPATMDDAEILLEWRNDPITQKNSQTSHEITKEDHIRWLESSLGNAKRKLYIAYENEVPVGTVRADLSGNAYQLSWTVAPSVRGKGIGKRMVLLFAEQLRLPIKATVKRENIASRRIAEYVGMKLLYEKEGIQYFQSF